MALRSKKDALDILRVAWKDIKTETRQVLGSELHYQAMIYHCLRKNGVPMEQLGMNVKQWIESPISPLFQSLDAKKHQNFQGGFEPIPDIVIFKPTIKGDWRRRRFEKTLRRMLVAIEVKASERQNGRLRPKEIINDMQKLAAQRDEVENLGAKLCPIMMVVDVTDIPNERMTGFAIEASHEEAKRLSVGFCYVSQDEDFFHVQ